MSGHSKWHNIQVRKGKQDAIRSSHFTKAGKAITIAAQKGGGDPETNFSLRIAIEKAKEVGMPKDNIERAIKRGTGESKEGIQIEDILYESYGPGGVAIIIKVLTDNRNRTVSNLKHLLSEAGGSLAGLGSVMWMFEQFGVISFSKENLATKGIKEEEFELSIIEAGAEDIQESEGKLDIKTKVENFHKVLSKIKEMGVEVEDSGLQWVAKDKIQADEALSQKLQNLFAEFEANDDVEDFFTNAE